MGTRVFVGPITSDVGERELRSFFRNHGKLLKVDIFHGYAFVEFKTSREANQAIEDMSRAMLCGKRVDVQLARDDRRRERPPVREIETEFKRDSAREGHWVDRRELNRTDFRLIVTNLASDVKFWELKEHFRKTVKGVVYADVRHDPFEGLVEFGTRADMIRGLQMNRSTWKGRIIGVVEDETERYGRRIRVRSRSPRQRSQVTDHQDPSSATASEQREPVNPPPPSSVPNDHPPPMQLPREGDRTMKEQSLLQKTWTHPDWHGQLLPNDNKVIIGSIPPTATVEQLVDRFKGVEGLIEARLVMIPETEKNRGYGYLTFRDREGAAAASRMDGMFKLESFQTQKSLSVDLIRPNASVLILNIGKTTTSAELYKRYNSKGGLLKVLADRDPDVSKRHPNRGFCVAVFKSSEPATLLKNEINRKRLERSQMTVAKWADPTENDDELEGEEIEEDEVMDISQPPSDSLVSATDKVSLMDN